MDGGHEPSLDTQQLQLLGFLQGNKAIQAQESFLVLLDKVGGRFYREDIQGPRQRRGL